MSSGPLDDPAGQRIGDPAASRARPRLALAQHSDATAEPGAARATPPGTSAGSDAELIAAYVAGDAEAFARLYDRHERTVYRFILRQVQDAAVADDLLQDTWLAVVRAAQTYTPQANAAFTTWLLTIARNRVLDHFRARRPDVSFDDTGDDDEGLALADQLKADTAAQPESQALSRQQARAFLDAVEALPAAQREAFLLHAEGGLSVEDIALHTGVGFETAKSRLRYAMNRLKDTMKQHGFGAAARLAEGGAA
ncbi:MAG TPA: sigma-70 family RNA polymerase sigma factor [Burkholderiaceae bacterium]|nr:sigma-70 family RNA polymerase sigma factor [Burkholderiaceae bacterium]